MMLKIYFISAIFVRFTADSEAAETINCNPIWRRVGDNVTIPCSYRPKSDQNGYLDIEWAIRNVNESDQTILTQAGGKVYVTPGWQQRISFASENGSKGDASLYFNSLDVNDSGIYNCKVKIDGKIEQKTCNLTVQVQDVPDIELMSKSPTTVKPTPTNAIDAPRNQRAYIFIRTARNCFAIFVGSIIFLLFVQYLSQRTNNCTQAGHISVWRMVNCGRRVTRVALHPA
ncbi:CXADR-like membrane protein isoform X3 [Scyliorhinus canicula]|uniref:CXADR-like membrane protein isoform X3 n=1 Tax=Scyliorhinus canicula TaxID=7830 RepID=UPI0018F2AD6F|nr:CXADR-like membrane protein isoform X3 [Scyliorhinus canicula]